MIPQKNVFKCLLLVVLFLSARLDAQTGKGLKAEQQKNSRVKEAYTSKWPGLKKELQTKSLATEDFQVYLRAFKYEKKLEVWVKNKTATKYTLLKTYDICATSGELGPKRKEGDGQIPEGFYTFDLYNPTSNYYLSMRVSYPNASDRILAGKNNPGSAIMVHGNCVTIGCIPITDEKIKELYVLCLEAQNNGNAVHIDIYPCRFSESNGRMLDASFPNKNKELWASLKSAYTYFEKNHSLRKVKVNKDGGYYFE